VYTDRIMDPITKRPRPVQSKDVKEYLLNEVRIHLSA
jgi:hypothetical protein